LLKEEEKTQKINQKNKNKNRPPFEIDVLESG
jgi:hypothetical protein